MNASPASMNSHENVFSMRVQRLTYQSKSSPFGLWTLPNQVDGPSLAPCYAPYGEQSPPTHSCPVLEHDTAERMRIAKPIEGDVLKPWEKGSKSGKRIKKGRGPKIRVGRNLAGDVASSDMSSFQNSSGVSSNASSISATSTRSSSQNSPASRTGRYPVLDAAQHARHPTAPVLARPSPYHSQHPDKAQAAIALSRKRKHDLVENEAPALSIKMYKRE